MAKEKQKMTLNVRKRATSVSAPPPAIESSKIEAFASGAETAKNNESIKSLVVNSSEQKVIRDAFTMPAEDHELFTEIQRKCLSVGMATTKSEIVRAGLKHLASLDNDKLQEIIKAVPKIKTGRPVTSLK
jgi:hypothetical protein